MASTFTTPDPTLNGLTLDFTGEGPLTYKYILIIGDDFAREYTLQQDGFDYTGTTIEYWLSTAKPPRTGEIMYNNAKPVTDVVLPVDPTPGSCKFVLDIPDTSTSVFVPGTLYGACRATYPDGTKDTLFRLELKVEAVI